MVAYYLYGVFIRADSAVGTEAKELAADCSLGSGVDHFVHIERCIRYVVDDTYREVILRAVSLEVIINRLDH